MHTGAPLQNIQFPQPGSAQLLHATHSTVPIPPFLSHEPVIQPAVGQLVLLQSGAVHTPPIHATAEEQSAFVVQPPVLVDEVVEHGVHTIPMQHPPGRQSAAVVQPNVPLPPVVDEEVVVDVQSAGH